MSSPVHDQTASPGPDRPSRYMFDEVFALDTNRKKSTPPLTQATLDAAVEAARKEAHAAGLAEGRKQAERDIQGRLNVSLGKLVAAMTEFATRVDADRAQAEEDAVRLALTAIDRLVPALISREPTAEVGALLHECLSSIRDVPHIAVRVSEDLVEPMRERFDRVAAQTGFTGRVVVLGEPDIKPGDGRIDWADGGIVRDMDQTRAAIETAINDFMAAKSAGPAAIAASAQNPAAPTPAPGDENNE